jgi:hypothetical protein
MNEQNTGLVRAKLSAPTINVTYFIKYLPSHFKIMILSHAEPKLNVMREWTGAQVGKINIRDLSFDYGEVAVFFQAKGYRWKTGLGRPIFRRIGPSPNLIGLKIGWMRLKKVFWKD